MKDASRIKKPFPSGNKNLVIDLVCKMEQISLFHFAVKCKHREQTPITIFFSLPALYCKQCYCHSAKIPDYLSQVTRLLEQRISDTVKRWAETCVREVTRKSMSHAFLSFLKNHNIKYFRCGTQKNCLGIVSLF